MSTINVNRNRLSGLEEAPLRKLSEATMTRCGTS